MNEINEESNSLNQKGWVYCPSCGKKLPDIDKQKFCLRCGIDIESVKNKKISLSSYALPVKPFYFKARTVERIPESEILEVGKRKLWNSFASIGIPIAAFILLNFITLFIMIFFIGLLTSPEDLIGIVLNPYFVVGSSFIELVFILIPVLYIGKYLQNSKISNRLALLGFTSRGYNNYRIMKEILIGLGFAVVAFFLVFFVSLFIQFILELIFGIEIVYSAGGSLNEVDMIIANSDIVALILLILTMLIIIGPSEEILFRGFMQKGLVRSLGKIGGIIITAIVFSFIHLIGIFVTAYSAPIEYLISFLLNFFPYFAISLLLGLLFYWRKENLIAVVITHGFYNALTIIIAYIYFSVF